ncbi:hypothetical protein Ndes2526B_g08288 [Nannochloris sp. 'desiccata']|nr:hypothetical protein KSW81_001754 [Chlorella desiccata (nom. nud.)]KAH7616185.1 hypothetical protein NADE_001015 [Chlorella desiccata (nom. nud.)]
MPLQGPAHVPATISPPQVPPGVPTAVDAAAAEKYRNDVLKAHDINAAVAEDVDEASRYMYQLQCARYNVPVPSAVPIQLPEGAPDWAQALAGVVANGLAIVGGRLDTLTSRVDTLTSRVDTLTSRVDTLISRVDTLTSRVSNLEARTGTLEHSTSSVRMLALVTNRSATIPASPLIPVPHRTTGSMPPAFFPPTLGGLDGLTGPEVNELLTFYGLPTQGTLRVRRTRLGNEIGILRTY